MSIINDEKLPQPPLGLKALIEHCQNIYPDQRNPLQVTTLIKYWLGGQDPLDYISMYSNHGSTDQQLPPHWHYVSFGLSDLHGDDRVHINEANEINSKSGMGFELTFRLLKTGQELVEERQHPDKTLRPPTWPANLLQAIARYCFQTGNGLCVGDNIPWHKSLDGGSGAISRIRNILIAIDPQFGGIDTPFGTVDFFQIVGVTDEEVEQASRWNGRGVLNYLRQDTQTGGQWLITDMQRKSSVFELFPETLLNLQDDLEKQGSDLAGINAEFTFREISKQQNIKKEIDSNKLTEQCLTDENNPMQVSANISVKKEDGNFPQSMSICSNSLDRSCPLDYQKEEAACVTLDGIEITLAPYAAKFLVLAIKDRIRHGRHFTFKSQNLALTLVAESVTGSVVTTASPYGVIGYWIQVLISNDLVPRFLQAFNDNANLDYIVESQQRFEFNFPDKMLKFVVDQPLAYSTNI